MLCWIMKNEAHMHFETEFGLYAKRIQSNYAIPKSLFSLLSRFGCKIPSDLHLHHLTVNYLQKSVTRPTTNLHNIRPLHSIQKNPLSRNLSHFFKLFFTPPSSYLGTPRNSSQSSSKNKNPQIIPELLQNLVEPTSTL